MCLLLYSWLLFPFFSHIADMPGLACLNRLSTEVKSKSSPVCDCTTAAHALQRSKVHFRQGRVWYGCGNGCWNGWWWTPECVQLETVQHMVFSTAHSKTGLFLICLLRSSSGSVWFLHCCCFLVPWVGGCLLLSCSNSDLRIYCIFILELVPFSNWSYVVGLATLITDE